jgi:hypothetical protein
MAPLRRARRVLAAPFVVTAALAPACVVQHRPAPEPTPATTSPEGGGQPSDPVVIANPPRPTEPAPAPAPVGDGAWRDHHGKIAYVYDDGGVVWRDDAGRCTYAPKVDCPPRATCNPPPPREVACPDGYPGDGR